MDYLFGDQAMWFTVPALVGTLVFLFRLVLMTLGVGLGETHGVDFSDAHHGDPSDVFKAFSIQSLFVFLMGFGWGAFGMYRGFGWSVTASALTGLGGGVLLVLLLGMLFKMTRGLEGSGNVRIQKMLDKEGDVYATVPPRRQGRGQVIVTLEDKQRIYNAITEGEEIPTSTRVKVTAVNGDNSLTVARIW